MCVSRVWNRSIVSARYYSHLSTIQSPCPSGNPTSFAPLLSGRCVQMRFSIDQPACSFRTSASRERNISPWHKDAFLKERQDLVWRRRRIRIYFCNWNRSLRIPFSSHAQYPHSSPSHVTFQPLSSLISRTIEKYFTPRFSPKEIAISQIIIREQISV